jgi:hypothetical protein
MFKKYVPKVGKVSFQDVAKKVNIVGVNSDKFKKKAIDTLHKAGVNKLDAQSILSGRKKIEQSSMRKVFNVLNKDKVIKKTGTAVTDYVKAEKGKKLRIYNIRMDTRAAEVKAEKTAEELKATGQTASASKKIGQPGMSSSAFDHVAKLKTEGVDIQAESPQDNESEVLESPIPFEPDEEIKAMREQAEKNDLPID